jgi:hypothetical protein
MAKDSGYPQIVGGNERVDYVWGNFPMQPNEDRTDGTPVVVVANNATQNKSWSGYTVYPSGRLDAEQDNHATALAAYAGYPAQISGQANYMVTAASGNGTTVTYTSANNLAVGDVVTITNLPTSAFNLSGVTVASENALSFTVTNSATGAAVTGGRGRVEVVSTTDDGAYVSGVAYIAVPNVLSLATAAATDDLQDAGFGTVTVATAATNTASTITAVARTGNVATITSSGAGAKYPVGSSITVASLVAPDTALNGTYTVTANATNTVSYVTATSGTLSTTGLTVAGLTGTTGTIKTQSTAAGAASIAAGATITITPWA